MSIVDDFKKGYKTSEFWVNAVTVGTPVVALISGYEFDVEGAVTMIGLIFGGVGYAGSRTWLKNNRLKAAVAEQQIAAQPAPQDLDETDPLDDDDGDILELVGDEDALPEDEGDALSATVPPEGTTFQPVADV